MSNLAIHSLEKHFDGVYAVSGLTLTFTPGKVTGLIGPNGSGKSTLINLLTGIHQIDSGSIIIGKDTELKKICTHEVAGYGVTRTFQDVRLFEQMTVLDNILLVLTERSIGKSLFERKVTSHLQLAEDVLSKVGLSNKSGSLASTLSYGQRKLLEIARVLAMSSVPKSKVEIVFLDEPFAGLFPEMIKIVTTVIKKLKDSGKTVVLVEHNMELIRELSDYIVVLDAGKLLAEGAPQDVLSRPDVIEAYLGE